VIKRAFLILAAGIALYLLIPRIGGLQRNVVALRHAHVWLMLIGIAVEAASLGSYILLYRDVIRAQGYDVSVLGAGQGVMAGFLVSHLVPGGSAAGTVANIRTMEREGIGARVTGVAVTLTAIVSAIALVIVFFAGFVYSLLKGSLPAAYVVTAAIAIPLLGGIVGTVFLFAFKRELAATVVRSVGRALHRVWHRIDPDALALSALEAADEARAVLGGRRFPVALAYALANWVLDVLVLYLFFLAVGHHQHFGALLVAYGVANLVSVIPITPSGLGVMEATLVAISVGFGAPRSAAVVAVLGYRLVNFWLPLPVGLAAYVRSRTTGREGSPA